MMKPETVQKLIKRMERSLERHYCGKYAELSMDYITDKITWLHHYKHITQEQFDRLVNMVLAVYEGWDEFPG